MRFRTTTVFVTCMLFLAAAASWAQVVPYSQDFEGLNQADPNALAADGWLFFGIDFIGGYGPFPAPNGGNVSAIVIGEGGPPQGDQQLSVFSDYANANHPNGIETNVFQEWSVGPGNVGETWIFEWDHKKGNIEGQTTTLAFIKTLDPNNGFPLITFETFDTTNIPDTWGGGSLQVTIDPSWAPGGTGPLGHLVQIGFLSDAANFEGSGIFYDNINFSPAPAVPATGNTALFVFLILLAATGALVIARTSARRVRA